MIRPAGIAPGAAAFAASWFAALAIVMLTGATAVVILLAVGAVGFLLAAIAGAFALRRVVVDEVAIDELSTVGADLRWHVSVRGHASVKVDLLVCDRPVATGIVAPGSNSLDGVAPSRGVHTEVEVTWTSGGRPGLVIWRRRLVLPIAPLSVAPAIDGRGVAVERITAAMANDAAAGTHTGHDEPDGVRSWRDGDDVVSVHWPSSLRTGELILRQRLRNIDEDWIVCATSGTDDPDGEAARILFSLEDGLTRHARVAVRVDNGEPQPIGDRGDAMRWCAGFEPRARPPRLTWWQRPIHIVAPESDSPLSTRARSAVAAASAVPLVMLLEPLGYGVAEIAIVLAAVALGAAVSSATGGRRRILSQVAGLAAAILVTASLIDVAQIVSVATTLRFLLPQILVALVVLQGYECNNRRAARVSLACSAILCAYSAGLRVDDRLGSWLVVAGVCWAWALVEITRSDRSLPNNGAIGGWTSPRIAAGRVAWLVAAAVGSLAILAVVPVPRGPVQLTLPSWLEERRPTAGDGTLAGPDGSPLLSGSAGGRGSGGSGGDSAGSYVGFSQEMNTSLRGDLGDEVVLRVRAASPDFWRGQTFTTFDGRSWSLDDHSGVRTDGPDHVVFPAWGDVRGNGGEQFVQTFYTEVDLPNLIFAATSARRVLLDAPLWQRPDGALRADVVLPAGSAYTVVSERSEPTAALLRLDGDVSVYGSPDEFLQLPESTTGRVRDLARQLSVGQASTYDTVVAIEQWLGEHVGYDLDAPVPPEGADAVDDFLFESQRGFCEQIATATAVMLRSLGVPARIATGFVPSERDEVAGVWISRAKDAHAWVEVHFPSYGWVAFDPTASVPLAGEASDATIGNELLAGLRSWVSDHIGALALGLIGVALVLLTARAVWRWRARRRRGRWGLLQDRFVDAAVRRGAPPTESNAHLASAFGAAAAANVAQRLDASAFDPRWVDDDSLFEETAIAVRELETSGARALTTADLAAGQ